MVETNDITIAICAFNAEKTIERAVRSAVTASSGPILLVDDFCTDQTVALAAKTAGNQLRVVQPLHKHGIGNARQTALENIKTPYGLWLDADDEILPHRAANMLKTFKETGVDLIFDACELVDGASSNTTAHLTMPAFLKGAGIWRLFERNWLPGLCGGFNTNFARSVGYDRSFYNSEDYDFTLRALTAGAACHLSQECGYRYYHYPQTVSRNLKQATGFTANAVSKHSLAEIDTQLSRSKVPEIEQKFLLCCAALTSGKYEDCIHVAATVQDPQMIQPYKTTAASLTAYFAGSAYLKQNKPDAALAQLENSQMATADCINNIGACHKLLGNKDKADACFRQALQLLPGYVDAVQNLKNADHNDPPAITLLPLRRLVGRSQYA